VNNTPTAKKSLGQHWLNDKVSLEAMCLAAEISKSDTVLEIGPGLGALTEFLVKRASRVVAVEFDTNLAKELPNRIKTPNLEVFEQDILKFDFTSLPADYKLAANIPYYLTSNLVRVLSESTNPPQVAALLIQKEVAERVTAAPGNLSILGVTAQFYWEVSLGRVVKAEAFSPPPKVDSQIVILHRRVAPMFTDVDAKLYFRIVKAGFSQKRKTLLNSLSAGLQLSRQQTLELLQKAGIPPAARAQTLSLEDWYKLCEAFV
jgi:16S rRNA (adenine1518-N6/adenine1519-N6)-dimethyltransferase